MRAEIEIDDVLFDTLVVQDLAVQIKDSEYGYKVPMFSYDLKEEKRKTKKVKKALKIVSAWYGSTEYDLEELLK